MLGLGDSEVVGDATPSQGFSADCSKSEIPNDSAENATAHDMEEQDTPKSYWRLSSKLPSRWKYALTRFALESVFRKIESIRLRDSDICDSLRPFLSALAADPCSVSARNVAIRAGFERWRLVMESRSRALIAEEAKQLSSMNASLEQRITKLKGLLAKVHQANQKHSEESSAVRREREEVVRERESLRSREDQERRALELQLRERQIESAFQQDVEIAIQRAAQAVSDSYIINQLLPGGTPRAVVVDNKSVTDVTPALAPDNPGQSESDEYKMQTLKEDIEALKLQLADGLSQVETSAHRLAVAQRELAAERAQTVSLRRQVEEEAALRRDVEAELRIVVAGSKIAANQAEIALTVATNARVQELTESLAQHAVLVEGLKRENKELQHQLDRASKETSSARRSLQGLLALERENKQLHVVLKEFRRMCGGNPLSGVPVPAQGQAPSSAAVIVSSSLGHRSAFEQRRAVEVGAYAARAWHFMESLDNIRKELFLRNSSYVRMPIEPGKNLLWLGEENIPCMDCSPDLVDVASLNDIWRSVNNRREIVINALVNAIKRHLDEVAVRLEQAEETVEPLMTSLSSSPSVVPQSPMMWEAHSFTLAAGKDLGIPVPEMPKDSQGAILEWVIWGDGVSYLQLSAAPLGNEDPSIADAVASKAVGASGVFAIVSSMRLLSPKQLSAAPFDPSDGISGSMRLSPGSPGKLFKILNSAMWYSATFSYVMRLSYEASLEVATTKSEPPAVRDYGREVQISELRALIHSSKRNLEEAVERYQGCRIALCDRVEELESQLDVHVTRTWEQAPYLLSTIQGLSDPEFRTVLQGYRCDSQSSGEVSFGGLPALRCIEMHMQHDPFPPSELIPEVPVDGPIRSGQSASQLPSQSLHFAAESLAIPAGGDFRLPAARVAGGTSVKVTWDFSIITENPGAPAGALDIGFAVLLQRPDGTLPLAVPYRRCGSSSGARAEKGSSAFTVTDEDATVVVLFDNTYSWLTPKTIRYSVSIQFSTGGVSKTESPVHLAVPPASPSPPHPRRTEEASADEDEAARAFTLLPLFAFARGGREYGDVEEDAIASFKSRACDILRSWSAVRKAATAEMEALANLEETCSGGGEGGGVLASVARGLSGILCVKPSHQ